MWLFFGLPLLVIFGMIVIHASSSLDKVRASWNDYRCNPIYMPFAGWIRPDISTGENFYTCVNLMGSDIFKYILDGIHELFGTLNSGISEVTGSLFSVKGLVSKLRGFLLSFGATTFSKITSATSSMTYIIIKIRDILKRFVGEGYIAAFLTETTFNFLLSFVYLFISILKTFVYTLLAISFILALFQPEILAVAVVLASLVSASGF
jgi:hypothetical protein